MKKKDVKQRIQLVPVFPYMDKLIRRKRSAGKESTAVVKDIDGLVGEVEQSLDLFRELKTKRFNFE